mmetsp:Transcript_33491/g.54721  ORF Transcript_33491/g.54721 Transcript_33491/m.54721 type:complete len:241 (+) Transcript_33491:150-872(+)
MKDLSSATLTMAQTMDIASPAPITPMRAPPSACPTRGPPTAKPSALSENAPRMVPAPPPGNTFATSTTARALGDFASFADGWCPLRIVPSRACLKRARRRASRPVKSLDLERKRKNHCAPPWNHARTDYFATSASTTAQLVIAGSANGTLMSFASRNHLVCPMRVPRAARLHVSRNATMNRVLSGSTPRVKSMTRLDWLDRHPCQESRGLSSTALVCCVEMMWILPGGCVLLKGATTHFW